MTSLCAVSHFSGDVHRLPETPSPKSSRETSEIQINYLHMIAADLYVYAENPTEIRIDEVKCIRELVDYDKNSGVKEKLTHHICYSSHCKYTSLRR